MASTLQQSGTDTDAPRLFISYARVGQDRVRRLATALERGGYRVWWDAALEGGHHFAAEIDRELARADAVVVVWSREAIASHWVLDEAAAGRDRNCLIPVRYDGTEPPLGFRQLQVIDLEDGDEAQAVGAIGRAVARITGNRPPPLPPPTPLERVKGVVQTMMQYDGGLGMEAGGKRGGKAEKPVWVPFAWVGVGILVWILSSILR